jgi:hypothetical protein
VIEIIVASSSFPRCANRKVQPKSNVAVTGSVVVNRREVGYTTIILEPITGAGMGADKDRVFREASSRVGAARAAKWFETVPSPGFSTWPPKDFVEGCRYEEVVEDFEAVYAGVFA